MSTPSGKLESNKIAPNGTVKVTFTIKNTGQRDGDDVAQLYYRHVNSKVPQPKLSLCGFSRVSLKSGGATEVTIEVPAGTSALLGRRRRNNTWSSRVNMRFSSARPQTTSG